MYKLTTKYFGEIILNQDDNVFDKIINIAGKEQEISIFIDSEEISTKIDMCAKILDDYVILFERGKKILIAEYLRNTEMKNHFFELTKKYEEEIILDIFGFRNIEDKSIEEIIEKLDFPNIRIVVKDGIEKIYLIYGLSEEIDEMIVVKMNRKYEMEDIRYYEWGN
jgi:hypothetical protein